MFAVTGATGQLGRLAIGELKKRGLGGQTVALARHAQKASDLGVEVREFDYDKTETLPEALGGITKLLLISGSEVGKREAQHKAVIAAAKQAGVKTIVYTSLLHADTSPIVLGPEHRASEEAIKASGLDYTILRNSWYTENYTGSLGGAVASGTIAGSAGDGKVTTASRPELAEAAVNVLTSDDHSGEIYELGNDEPYSLADLAAETSRQSGKPVVFTNLPKAEYTKLLEGFGLPPAAADMIADSDEKAASGALYDDSKTLSKLLGRPTQSLKEAVAQALKA